MNMTKAAVATLLTSLMVIGAVTAATAASTAPPSPPSGGKWSSDVYPGYSGAGQVVDVNETVQPVFLLDSEAPSGAPAMTGTVSFDISGPLGGEAMVSPQTCRIGLGLCAGPGLGEFNLTGVTGGVVNLTVKYSGDGNYYPSSSTVPVIVERGTPAYQGLSCESIDNYPQGSGNSSGNSGWTFECTLNLGSQGLLGGTVAYASPGLDVTPRGCGESSCEAEVFTSSPGTYEVVAQYNGSSVAYPADYAVHITAGENLSPQSNASPVWECHSGPTSERFYLMMVGLTYGCGVHVGGSGPVTITQTSGLGSVSLDFGPYGSGGDECTPQEGFCAVNATGIAAGMVTLDISYGGDSGSSPSTSKVTFTVYNPDLADIYETCNSAESGCVVQAGPECPTGCAPLSVTWSTSPVVALEGRKCVLPPPDSLGQSKCNLSLAGFSGLIEVNATLKDPSGYVYANFARWVYVGTSVASSSSASSPNGEGGIPEFPYPDVALMVVVGTILIAYLAMRGARERPRG